MIYELNGNKYFSTNEISVQHVKKLELLTDMSAEALTLHPMAIIAEK